MRESWERVFEFWKKYEHHIGVGALATGFFFDLVVADRPDSIPNNILLLSYLFIAAAFIVILNLREVRRRGSDNPEPLFLLLVLQFCFGGLASNLLVLYGRSGTLAGSTLFIGLLAGLVIGNEYLRTRYSLLKFNVSVYYILLLTYCVVAVPTFITHSVGALSFLVSGALSVIVISAFLFVLYISVFRGKSFMGLRPIAVYIGIIFIVFNMLYFLNVIPPVPLALKDVGIYHSLLRRSAGDYVAIYEKAPWYAFWRNTNAHYTLTADKSAFCYSSVFAPTDLQAPIYHRWEAYNELTDRWEERSRVSFGISGGRADGYRGYTTKSALTTGTWRCNVETEQGALIGRTTFTVVEGPEPTLSTKTL